MRLLNFIIPTYSAFIQFLSLLTIAIYVIALVYMRNLKEKRWGYSDPVMNTLLGTLYPLLCGMFLLYVLNILEYRYLNAIYQSFYVRWSNRDVGIFFSAEHMRILLFFLFIQFPLKSISYFLIAFIACLLYRLLVMILRKKDYFFRDRNNVFRVFDENTGKMRKVYYSVKILKPLYQAMARYDETIGKYFKEKAEILSRRLSRDLEDENDENLKRTKRRMFNQSNNFYQILSDFSMYRHHFKTNLSTNNVREMVYYTIPHLLDMKVLIGDNILKFAELYKNVIDKKEAEFMFEHARMHKENLDDVIERTQNILPM